MRQQDDVAPPNGGAVNPFLSANDPKGRMLPNVGRILRLVIQDFQFPFVTPRKTCRMPLFIALLTFHHFYVKIYIL